MRKWLPEILVLAAGFLIGKLLWGDVHSLEDHSSDREATASKPATDSPGRSPLPSLQRNRTLRDLESWDPGPHRTAEAVFALRSCTSADLQAFWEALVASEPEYSALKSLTLQRWMELDPQAALAATAGTREELQAWSNWGKVDPAAALAAAELADRSFIRPVLGGCATADPHLAMKLAEKYPDLDMRVSIAGGLKRRSYREALDYFYSQPLLRNWSTDQPRAAFDWALQNLSKLKQRRDWEPIVDSLFASEPAYLAETIGRLPAGEARTMLEGLQARKALRGDPEGALALVRGKNYDPYAIPDLGESLAIEHPEESLVLFREFEARNPIHAAQATEWIRRLLAHDPDAVMQAAALGLRSPLTMRTITDMWMNHDRYEFAEWLAEQPASNQRDNRFRALADRNVQSNHAYHHAEIYAESLGWAGQIDESKDRRGAIQSVLRPWIAADPVGVGRFFEAGARSADERAVYEGLLEGRQP